MVCKYYDKEHNRCKVFIDHWEGLGTHTPKPEEIKEFCLTDANYQKCPRFKVDVVSVHT